MKFWQPEDTSRQNANLTRFCSTNPVIAPFAMNFDYKALHHWSVTDTEAFWSQLWDFCGVIGDKGHTVLLNRDKMPGAQWFPEARLNFAENLLRERPDDDVSDLLGGGTYQKVAALR